MPITKQAIKKLKRDRKRAMQQARARMELRRIIKEIRVSPSKKTLNRAFQALDKAVKHHIIHRNRASRLKSRLSKLLKK